MHMDIHIDDSGAARSVTRVRVWYAMLLVVFGIFAVRLFYVQVINHQIYARKAANDQMREYEVDADRGTIYAQLGDKTVPLVVNQKLYTVYADPTLIKKPQENAEKLSPIIGVPAQDIQKLFAQKKIALRNFTKKGICVSE